MIFLILSIIAAIILVAVVIRRLPYLRTHRLGLEITTPRPYLAQPAWWQGLIYRVQTWFQTIRLPKRYPSLPSNLRFGQNNNREQFTPHTPLQAPQVHDGLPTTAYPEGYFDTHTVQNDEEAPAANVTATASPDSFWEDEPHTARPDTLNLPPKGLITRRGESQKIAHELISHADSAFRKKEFKEAEKFYLQAATKDPDNARIYNRLGVIYLKTKNYKDAVEAFRGAIKFDDRVASRHYNLALAYMGKRDYRSAEKGLKEAIRLEPTNEKYRQTLQAISKGQPA